jgi:hypothetical protein
MLDNSFERVAAHAALGDEDALLEALAELAAMGQVAALRKAFADEGIAIRWPDGRERILGPGPLRFTPPAWLATFCAATLVRDRAALRALTEHLQQVLDTAPEGPGDEPWWPPLCRAMVGALRGDAGTTSLAGQARAEIDADCVNGSARPLKRPLLDLSERVATLRFADWPARVAAALRDFDDFYAHPEMAGMSGGFLPLGIAALCAMAHEQGAPPPPASPYLPQRLISGRLPAPRFEVSLDPGQGVDGQARQDPRRPSSSEMSVG